MCRYRENGSRTSKKIRAAVKAKAERGERVGTVVPYGYKRDFEYKGHLLINEETAPIVRMIFSLCAKGTGPRNIANILRNKKILKPTAYRYQTEGVYAVNILMINCVIGCLFRFGCGDLNRITFVRRTDLAKAKSGE